MTESFPQPRHHPSPPSPSVALRPGDLAQALAWLARRKESPPCLVCTALSGKTQVVRLRPILTVGSSGRADVRVGDSTVSELHCLICRHRVDSRQGGGREGWFLYDLDSKNGTWLNGARIHRPNELRQGDCIQMGRTHLFVVLLTR